jgi:hypothetical protein
MSSTMPEQSLSAPSQVSTSGSWAQLWLALHRLQVPSAWQVRQPALQSATPSAQGRKLPAEGQLSPVSVVEGQTPFAPHPTEISGTQVSVSG